MFEREMILSGLQKQRNLLSGLIDELEKNQDLNRNLYEGHTRQVAQNLRKLRRIKKNYFDFRESIRFCS